MPEAVANTDSSAIWHLPPVPLLYVTSHLARASCAVAVTNTNSSSPAARASSHVPPPRGHVVPEGIGAGTETGPYVCTNYHFAAAHHTYFFSV
jgi:hypothetical protein